MDAAVHRIVSLHISQTAHKHIQQADSNTNKNERKECGKNTIWCQQLNGIIAGSVYLHHQHNAKHIAMQPSMFI